MSVLQECGHCKREFRKLQNTHRFCSKECRNARYGADQGFESLSKKWGITHSKLGAAAELRVCADLLQRGFEVFRAVSPDASADLVIFKQGGPILRVEVKTGYEGERREYQLSPRANRSDVLAVVTRQHIRYQLTDLEGELDEKLAAEE